MLRRVAEGPELERAPSRSCGASIAGYFSRHAALVGGAETGLAVRERSVADYGLLRVRYAAGSCFELSSLKESHTVCVVLSGAGSWDHRERSLELFAGDVVVLNPHESFTISHCSSVEYLLFRMPSTMLACKAREHGYHVPEQGVRLAIEKVPPEQALQLYHLLNALHQQEWPQVPILHYASIIAHQVITQLANNLRRFHMVRPARNPLIERVRRHVLEHAREDVRVEDLARLCQISVKSVYNLFERELGIRPSLYVRHLKLECAHIALMERGRNVTEVALEYGFRNLSRFSSYYRECFGELPSQTLRRGGQQAAWG